MKKLKLSVLFGGVSTEHNVSILSGTSVIKNLDKKKYDIFPIYISKDGNWYKYIKDIKKIDILQIGEFPNELELISNVFEYLSNMDVVFPVLHGLNGEDGTIQGMLELIGVPYVGCRVLGSSICMDKVYTKAILKSADIRQVKYMYIKKLKKGYKLIGFPMFIKPSNSGSSVGINKASNISELIKYVECASKYDNKILIEQAVNARELECAALGSDTVNISCIGEVLSGDEFYSYDAKYKNSSSRVVIPANITKDEELNIKSIAKKVFYALDCKGLSRIDFFIDNTDNSIYVNEVNTMPGFTDISMYPKLFENSGIKYSKLLDKLIDIAIKF